jgi:hypothetical protein
MHAIMREKRDGVRRKYSSCVLCHSASSPHDASSSASARRFCARQHCTADAKSPTSTDRRSSDAPRESCIAAGAGDSATSLRPAPADGAGAGSGVRATSGSGTGAGSGSFFSSATPPASSEAETSMEVRQGVDAHRRAEHEGAEVRARATRSMMQGEARDRLTWTGAISQSINR